MTDNEKLIDLHTHSTESDGTLSPEELIKHAKEQGLSAIALTDHDAISGIEKARPAAAELGLEFVPGVELSTEYEGKEIPEHWKVMLTPVTPKEKGYPHFRNVWLSDVKATNVQTFITAAGWNEELPLQNFHISGIKAKVNKAGSIIFTEDFHLENVRLQVEDGSRVEEKNNKNAQINISYENNMEL